MSNLLLVALLGVIFTTLVSSTPLTTRTINAFNEVYPRCFNASAPQSIIRSVEEVPSLFSKKLKVTLAPKGKCSFLGTGNTMLEWDEADDPMVTNQVWTYVLNYTGSGNNC